MQARLQRLMPQSVGSIGGTKKAISRASVWTASAPTTRELRPSLLAQRASSIAAPLGRSLSHVIREQTRCPGAVSEILDDGDMTERIA